MKNNRNGARPDLTRSLWRAKGNGTNTTLAASSRMHSGLETAISGLGIRRVKHLINEATRRKVLVLGDIMLDEFIWGSVRRISPEAPVPVVQLDEKASCREALPMWLAI
jgi:hypothetical protein